MMLKTQYLSTLAALATAGAIVLFTLLAAPVAKPFALALIIGISTMPHYNRLLRWMPKRPGGAAGLMILAITICFILPTVALMMTASLNATDWYQQVEQLLSSVTRRGSDTLRHVPLFTKITYLGQRYGIDLADIWKKLAAGSSTFLFEMATAAAKNLLDFLVTLVVALFILFFIYRDGERVVRTCIARMASNPAKADRFVGHICSITTAVTVGTIFTCCTQGVTAGIGYYFADVPAPIFFGALTAIAALVPIVGTGVIWVPLTVLVAIHGSYMTATLLALWCMIFVGLADNAIRPLAIGAASDIPVLAIVLGAICGVVTMGILGLILGPVIFAILMTLWDELVADVLPAHKAVDQRPPSQDR